MKRAMCVVVLAAIVMLTFSTGCRKKVEPPPEGTLPQVPEVAAQARETGFSIELGEPPQFEAKVEPYEIAEGLGNVANLAQFKDDLRPEHIKAIAENGFVVVPAEWRQMEFVYELNNYERAHKPSVATADSILHTFHIFYDYVLRTIEVSTLYERASTLAVGLLEGAQASYEAATEAEIREAALCNFAFAAVPAALLEVEHEVAIPEEVAELVAAELALIEAHEDFRMSPTVGFKVDYSQFVPRGHYTRSEKLKRYFKGMMWYGLMPVAMRNMRDELAPRQCRQAVLLAQILLNGKAGDEALTEVWKDVYEPTAFMVGFADDNTPDDFGEAMTRLFGAALETQKLIPQDNLEKLADEVLKLRPPGIVMASIRKDPQKPGIPQFRVMGQRYVLDSHIFQMMVTPHVGKGEAPPDFPGTYNVRTFPMGLDLMSVLGSKRAYEIADEVYQQTNFGNYAEQTEKMREEVGAYTERDWTKNVYAGWLHTLKLLVEVKGEGYPSFMLTEAWVDKALNAALGSWAELRHDTILYAKQSVVAECGGEGGEQKPPPPPKGYVEPEVLTYWRLRLLATQLRDGLQERNLLTDEMLVESFGELISLLQFLEDVSVKELTGQQLSAEEFQEIEYYGDTLSRLNLYSKRGAEGDEITSMTDKDMAVIADVHTGTIGGPLYALEEGVGHANEIYVVYPLDGKLLLGRGAVFDYYEFIVPVAERMTDEQWQQKLESGSPPQPPKWTESFLSPYRGSGETIEFQDIPEFTTGGC